MKNSFLGVIGFHIRSDDFHFFVLFCLILSYTLLPVITYAQNPQRLLLNRDIDLISEIKKLEANGITFSYDQHIKCVPAIDEAIYSYSDNVSDRIRKIACYCQIETLQLDNNQWLLRSKNDINVYKIITLKDALDNNPIGHALVNLPVLDKQLISDMNGNIFLTFNKKDQPVTLKIQSLRYGEIEIQISDKSQQKILLTPKTFSLPQIVYQKSSLFMGNDFKGIYTVNKKTENTGNRYSQFTNASGTITLLLPSVVFAQDKSGTARIRGSEQSATLLMIDQMPVYKADHFFGIFSAINPDYVDKITLHRNAIPVQHGGRMSGMLEYQSKEILSKSDLTIHTNLLQAGFGANLKIADNTGIILAGRLSYTNLLQSPFFDAQGRIDLINQNEITDDRYTISSSPGFDFRDLNVKIYHHIGYHRFSAGLFGSSDHFTDNYNLQIDTRFGSRNLEIFNRNETWQNLAYQIQHEYKIKDIKLSSIIYTSNYSNIQYLQHRLRQNSLIDPTPQVQTLDNSNQINDLGFKTLVEKINNGRKMQIGFESIRHNNELNISGLGTNFFEHISQPWEHNLFLSDELKPAKQLLLKPGLRVSYIPSFGKGYLQPQLYLQHYLGYEWKLKSSYSRHVQFMRQFFYETPNGLIREFFIFTNDSSIPVGKTDNWMIGATFIEEQKGFSLDLEGFYRSMNGILNYATRNFGIIRNEDMLGLGDFSIFNGEARIYGVDIVFNLHLSSLTLMAQYTWSKNENRYTEIFNNQWHPSPQDSRHQARIVASYQLGNFNFSASISGASGLPYQDLLKLRNVRDRNNLNPNDIISYLPDFQRTDIGIQYTFKSSNNEIITGLNVYNIFNRKNVVQRQFISQWRIQNNQPLSLESDVLQLERTYNLGLSIRI